MNFICEKHDQDDWECSKDGDVITHHMKPPEQWRNSNLSLKQVRCLNCICRHMDKQTEEIDRCEFYDK